MDMCDIDEKVPCIQAQTAISMYNSRGGQMDANLRTQTMHTIHNGGQYSKLERGLSGGFKTSASSHESPRMATDRKPQRSGTIEEEKMAKKFKQEKQRKINVQTPKIKPVRIAFVGANYQTQAIPGKLTSQNSAEDLHHDKKFVIDGLSHDTPTRKNVTYSKSKKADFKSGEMTKSIHDFCLTQMENIILEERPKVKHGKSKQAAMAAAQNLDMNTTA